MLWLLHIAAILVTSSVVLFTCWDTETLHVELLRYSEVQMLGHCYVEILTCWNVETFGHWGVKIFTHSDIETFTGWHIEIFTDSDVAVFACWYVETLTGWAEMVTCWDIETSTGGDVNISGSPTSYQTSHISDFDSRWLQPGALASQQNLIKLLPYPFPCSKHCWHHGQFPSTAMALHLSD